MARGLRSGARCSGSKYSTDLKVVMRYPSPAKVASIVEPSGVAAATALLVVPKSSPTTVGMGEYPSDHEGCVRTYAETPPPPRGRRRDEEVSAAGPYTLQA